MTKSDTQQLSRGDVSPWRDEKTLQYYHRELKYTSGEVGDILGCSRTTAVKWLKKFGIHTDFRRVAELNNREWLVEKYHSEELSVRDIAELLDCSKTGVEHALEKHSIETRNPHRENAPFHDKDTVITEYIENGNSMNDLANMWETSTKIIHHWLNNHGIEYRHPKCSGEDHGMWGRRGEDSPNWKGGTSKTYGPNWKRQRKKALERDNHTCQSCSTTDDTLHVHHRVRKEKFRNQGGDEWWKDANKLSNLVTLCPTCHGRWERLPIQIQVVG